jgi:hypothetical protein
MGALGVGLIVGGAVWYWRTTQSEANRPRRRKAAQDRQEKQAQAAAGEPVYCSQCGKRASKGDRFCRQCGSKI